MKSRFALITGLIILGISTRFFPHWPNFTALGAVALLGGSLYRKGIWAYLIPILVLFLSDLFINNVVYGAYQEGFRWLTGGFAFIYGAFLITALMGRTFIKKFKALPILGTGLGSAIIFFLLTNFGVWLSGGMYPATFSGLMMAYAAGLPFLLNMALANVFYGALLFGAAYYTAPRQQLVKA